MAGGRPSKYKPDLHPQMVIDVMRLGYSFEVFCARADIHKDTGYEWANKHPEFSDAKKRANALCLEWWETAGGALVNGQIRGNAAVWIFNMKNRFNWTDKTEISTPEGHGITLNYNLEGKKPEKK